MSLLGADCVEELAIPFSNRGFLYSHLDVISDLFAPHRAARNPAG